MSQTEPASIVTAEQRLARIGLQLPDPPQPFGAYVMAVQTGPLLFLTGMLPTEGREARYTGRVGAEVDVATARRAARMAAGNALAVARAHLGSLDRVRQVVRLSVSIATAGDFREHPKVADGASELLQEVFGSDKGHCRVINGVDSLALGATVALELIFDVS